MRRQARLANYGEIQTPTFEETGVFARGVGATTDIVEKEMYTFLDKGGDSMTLRPEATAGIMRAYLQRGMASRPQPVKLFMLLNTFRYDKPQKGRFREFHQIDFEAIGEADPLDRRGARRPAVATVCRARPARPEPAGQQHWRPQVPAGLHRPCWRTTSGSISTGCARSASADSKPTRCACWTRSGPSVRPSWKARPGAPTTCATSAARTSRRGFTYIEGAGIPYAINARLVRGLDYYTRSVWEVWPPVVGAQSTIGGGGRYDGLAEQLGGRPTPGVGFASGVERIILELKDQHVSVATSRPRRGCFWCTRPRAANWRRFAWQRSCARRAFRPTCRSAIANSASSSERLTERGRTSRCILGEDELASGDGHAQEPSRRRRSAPRGATMT